MGVRELLHFRRLLRRRRRVAAADGSRHFVIGFTKTEDASKLSEIPKGGHFVVSYDRCTLSDSELDACNNNSVVGNIEEEDGTASDTSSNDNVSSSSSEAPSSTRRGSSVVVSVIPGAAPNDPGSIRTELLTNSMIAVLTTTELEEVTLFDSAVRRELVREI